MQSVVHFCPWPPFSEAAAAFIASQLRPEDPSDRRMRRLVLLGLRPPLRRGAGCPAAQQLDGCEELQLAATLLRAELELVVLDRPLQRLVLETLLAWAAAGAGAVRGRCLLEGDLAAAFRAADAVLLLPGWRPHRPLAWSVLAGRMRAQAWVFDLRPQAGLERAAASGLQTWRVLRAGSGLPSELPEARADDPPGACARESSSAGSSTRVISAADRRHRGG